MASSPSVVADLTDEHYLDTTNFEWPLLQSEQQTDVAAGFRRCGTAGRRCAVRRPRAGDRSHRSTLADLPTRRR